MYDALTPCPSALEPLETRQLLSALPLDASLDAPVGALPAMIEQESLNGPANDEPAAAEALTFGWLLPWPSYEDGFGSQVAVVEGQSDGAGGVAFSGVRSVIGPLYDGMTRPAVYADVPAPSSDGLLRLTAKADLGGDAKYLDLWLEGCHLGSLFQTGGVTGINNVQIVVPMATLAAAAGDGVLEFAVQTSQAVAYLSGSFFSISLEYEGGSGGADFYRFDLQAGQSVDLSLTGATVETELWGPDMTVLSRAAAMDGSLLVAGFQAAVGGTYYVRVAGSSPYTLQVVRSGLSEAGEPGETIGAPLPGQGPQGDNWQSASGTLTEGDRDYYALAAPASGHLSVQASSPKGSATWLTMTLYDSAGNVVATSKGPHLKYDATPGETYYLEVTGLDGALGDYSLDVLTPKAKGK
ncbi:MAG: hypothetical protein BWX88_01659 [Planctomycetes bacterium ADurb.Bin126]|nr:MAG: hypothetical protein BWX88_01659 [Planctomycetes bacterium ADurb.Bin126]HOD84085.1 PPC domain-containing protein [Phycisphaerae bacterium]HQL73223.1 PPC domain-containing protein [Phycisphaerae bacterium]